MNALNIEIEFRKWWEHTGIAVREDTARIVWNCAFKIALDEKLYGVNQAEWDKGHEAGAVAERKLIEQKLLGMAGAAFVAGRDDHAHWFRSLVNVLFKSDK